MGFGVFRIETDESMMGIDGFDLNKLKSTCKSEHRVNEFLERDARRKQVFVGLHD